MCMCALVYFYCIVYLCICVFVYFMCVLQFTFKCQEIRNIATLQCCSGRKDTLRLLYRPKNCLCHCYCFCYFDCYLIYFFPLWIQRKDTYTPSFISSKEFSSPPPPPLAIPSCLFLSFLLWPQGDIALKIHTNEKTSSMLNSFHGFYKQPSDNISSSLISVFCQWKVKVFNFNQGWNARIRTQNLLHLKYFSIIITTSIKMIIAEIQVLNSNQGWNARIRMKLSQSFQARIKRIITWSYSSQSSQYLADYPAMSFLFVCKCK